MTDTDLQVTFSADASGVKAAAAEARSAIQDLGRAVESSRGAYDLLKKSIDAALNAPVADGGKAALDQVANQDITDKLQRNWDRVGAAIPAKFTQGIEQMIRGAKSFAQVMAGIGQQILNDFIGKVINPMIEQWLSKEARQTLASLTGNAARADADKAGAARSLVIGAQAGVKKVANEAYQAAAGAYNAMADIPIVGPVLGAAASAATFAAVMAFGGQISSAAGGWDRVPFDGVLARLHQNEMVLPATLANPLRAMIAANQTAGGGAPTPSNAGGDTHHHWNVQAVDARSFETYLRRNGDALHRVITDKVRAGAAIPAA